MLNHPIYTLVLAGGVGKRLFPLSTPELPKQFQDVAKAGKTLIQQAFERALEISDKVYISANSIHKELIKDQLAKDVEVIYEKVSLNTAYPIKVACDKLRHGIMVVMPSDHAISEGFKQQVKQAIQLAKKGKVVTFGIKPNFPNPHFGYILNNRFLEKPSMDVAEHLIGQGALWNSGIFVFDIQVMLAEFAKYCPEIKEPISFDKAIMEKTENLEVIEAKFDWMDLGSFESIENYKNKFKVAS